jgi:predicted amidohydrolase
VRDLTLRLVQADLRWHDAPANRARLEEMVRDAGAGADLVVLPEMFTTGFTMDTAGQAETMQGESIAWMRDLAADLGVTMAGSLIVRDGNQCFNRLIWMPPGGEPAHYDKRHLFRMADEQRHFAAGRARPVLSLGDWRICPLICYDLRFPVWSRGVDAYDLVLYVANWPAARRSAWNTLLPARAVENLCYSAGVNRAGTDGKGIAYAGDTAAYDFLGHAVARTDDREQVLDVTLDGAALRRYRDKFPAHLDADRFSIADG